MTTKELLAQLDAAISSRDVRIAWPGQSIAELQNARNWIARNANAADERDALRANAERYRWLRDEGWDAKFTAPAVHLVLEDGQIEKELDGPELDAAIDAAMKEPK